MSLAPVIAFSFMMVLVPNPGAPRPQGDPQGSGPGDFQHSEVPQDFSTSDNYGSYMGDGYNKSAGEQPFWERSGKFEGDMVLNPGAQARNGDTVLSHRWPNAIIPYQFAPGHFNGQQQNFIKNALKQFSKSCVRVVPRQNQANYVLVTKHATGCHSKIGYMGKGAQELNLQYDNKVSCLSTGTVVHEFLHAAGFYHQQSASERDNYVAIDMNNVQKDFRFNFEKYNTNNFGVAYDYQSVMHYNNYAFAIDKKRKTLWAKSNPNLKLGQDNGMTASDLLKLNRMYCQKSG